MTYHHALTDAATIHEEKHAGTALAGQILQYQGDGTGLAVQAHLGQASITLASADVTLSQVQASKAVLLLSGALGADVDLIVPTTWGPVAVVNNTTESYTVTVKTASGTGVALTQGKSALFAATGTNVIRLTPEN